MNNPIYKKSTLYHLFSHCLLSANHKPQSILYDGKIIQLKLGECSTTYQEISDKTDIPKSTVYKGLKTLSNLNLISQKGERRLTIIYVIKWDSYQQKGNDRETERKRRGNDRETTPSANPCPVRDSESDKNVRMKECKNTRLSKKNSTRSAVKYPKENYDLVISEYQNIKGISLQGDEYKPVQQAIKTMFMSDRTPHQIIDLMQWLENSTEAWTNQWNIDTVKKKMPEFLAGKLENTMQRNNDAKKTLDALIAKEQRGDY